MFSKLFGGKKPTAPIDLSTPSNLTSDQWVARGNELYATDKILAIEAYDRAIALDPNYGTAYNNKGLALNALSKYEDAIKAYDKAIELNPQYADAYTGKGSALDDLRKYEDAIKAYDKAIELNPGDATAYYSKGITLSKLRKYEDAIKAYDEAIELNPQYADAYYNKGIALSDLRKYEDAIKAYDKAIGLNPQYADAYTGKGSALDNLRKYEDAIKAYDKAIELDPSNALAYCNKGKLLQTMDRDIDALACFNKAYEISQSGNLGSHLSQDNISYINTTVSTDREKLLLKVKELQEQSMQIDDEISKLEASNDNIDVKIMLRQRSNSFKAQKTELINEAIDLLDPKNKATTEDFAKIFAKLIPFIAELAALKTQTEQNTQKIQEHNAHLQEHDTQIKILDDRLTYSEEEMKVFASCISFLQENNIEIMKDIESDKLLLENNVDIVSKLSTQVSDLRNTSSIEEKSDPILQEIYKSNFKKDFYLTVKKDLISTYYASIVVQSDIVENTKTGIAGDIGNMLNNIGSIIPTFGGAVSIFGVIISKIDHIYQEKMVENFANFVDDPSDISKFASSISKSVASKIDQQKLEKILSSQSSIMKILESSFTSFTNTVTSTMSAASNTTPHQISNTTKTVTQKISSFLKKPFVAAKTTATTTNDNSSESTALDSAAKEIKQYITNKAINAAHIVSSIIISEIFRGENGSITSNHNLNYITQLVTKTETFISEKYQIGFDFSSKGASRISEASYTEVVSERPSQRPNLSDKDTKDDRSEASTAIAQEILSNVKELESILAPNLETSFVKSLALKLKTYKTNTKTKLLESLNQSPDLKDAFVQELSYQIHTKLSLPENKDLTTLHTALLNQLFKDTEEALRSSDDSYSKITEDGKSSDLAVWSVTDIRYDNDFLNNPKNISDILSKGGAKLLSMMLDQHQDNSSANLATDHLYNGSHRNNPPSSELPSYPESYPESQELSLLGEKYLPDSD